MFDDDADSAGALAVLRNSSQTRCDGAHLHVAVRWGMMVIGILPLWGGHVLGRRG